MHGGPHAPALASPVAATPGRAVRPSPLSPSAAAPFATHATSAPSPRPGHAPLPSPSRSDAAGVPSHRGPAAAPPHPPSDHAGPAPLVLGAAAAEEANPRFRPTMEDCFSIHVEPQDSFFGVFDGHGGAAVAQCVPARPKSLLALRGHTRALAQHACLFFTSLLIIFGRRFGRLQICLRAPVRESEAEPVILHAPCPGGHGACLPSHRRAGKGALNAGF